MSAPVGPRTSHTALRAGAVAHRWAGVTGTDVDVLCAVGVRSDEEDRRVGESIVLDLARGRVTTRTRLPFAVMAVGGTASAPLFLDGHGGLWRLDGDTPQQRLDHVVRVVGGLALTDDGRVVAVDGAADRVLATGARGLGDGLIVVDDGVLLVDDGVVGRRIAWTPPATVTACHRDGDAIAVYGDQRLFVLDATRPEPLVRSVPGPAVAHCVARAPGRWLLGCSVGGLLALDDDDDALRVRRPSLRAHQILRIGSGFAAVSDLLIATSDDGVDWLGRDLTSVVRHFSSAS